MYGQVFLGDVCVLLVLDGQGQAFGTLLHDGQAHRQMKPVQQVLGLRVQVQLEVPHRVAPIGQERDLLIHLMPLRLQDLEQAPFRLYIQGRHKAKALAGWDILLVLASEDEDALADNDFEMLLFLLPVADIATIDPDREGAIGDGQGLPVGGTALHKGPLLVAQFVFAALGHRERMVLDGGRIERRLHGEKVLQRLRGQAVGHQRGPLGLHEEQLGSHRVSHQRVQRPEGGRLTRLTAAMIQPRTGEGDGAKEGAQGERVVPFDAQSLPTMRTLGMGFDKGGGLLLHKVVLQRREELFRFSQRQAEAFDALAGLVEDRHLMHSVFLTIS
jgi:hypothetical protein